MSTTTKSPKQLAAAAYRIARGTLPEYNSRYSPRKFTQPQLLVCLVLKTFFNTDYRGIVQILDDWPSLCTVFELKTVPHFTTLQKASHRLLKSRHARKLIECSVSSVIDTRKAVPLAALDATGLQSGHISPYFLQNSFQRGLLPQMDALHTLAKTRRHRRRQDPSDHLSPSNTRAGTRLHTLQNHHQ